MQFVSSISIYEQIVDFVYRRILRKIWSEDDRLPSVRELAVQLEVNPNTVQRAYSILSEEELVENRRGIGYFVAGDAADKARTARRRMFEEREIPHISEEMLLLDISVDELKVMIEHHREDTR